jgi:subtilisin family serine protease
MRLISRFALVCAATLTFTGALAGAAAAQVIPGQYIVVLNDGVRNPHGFASAHGISPHVTFSHAIRGFSAKLAPAALEALEKNPNVAWIEQDTLVEAYAQTIPDGITRIGAAPLLNGTALDVDVAVIDTGIDMAHSDLNVVGGVDCVRPSRKTGECKAGGSDDNGHGTHVAGTIAALDNADGVVGVAPGARLYAVKVLDSAGSGTRSGVIAGIDWVTANAGIIDVANMSLGGGGSDDTDGADCGLSTDAEHIAICNAIAAGVTFVVAAGNESTNAANSVPSSYDEVITVSALADFDGALGGLGSGSYAFSSCTESVDDSLACFSNYGHDVDIMAPGVGIYSTTLGGGYGSKSGTSMASPHVAGAAARLLAENPSWTPADVRAALLAAADGAPCAGPFGVCTDDPDGIQEPLLMVGPPADPCLSDAECDDANPCTVDACNLATGICASTPDDNLTCDGLCCGGQCQAPACSTDADCGAVGFTCPATVCANAGTCGASCEQVWGSECSGAHVHDVAMWLTTAKGKWPYQANGQVLVTDSQGAPVAGATVTADLTSPSGSVYAQSGVTDSNGLTPVFSLKSQYTGTYELAVTSVSHGTLPYTPGADVESCQGLSVPSGSQVSCN